MGNICDGKINGNVEVAEDNQNVAETAFVKVVRQLVEVAVDGYPRALQSSIAKRNKLLIKTNGDVDAAIEKILNPSMNKTFQEEVKEFLLILIPYIGVPAAIIYPLWKQLRRACVVAGLFGHDLHDESVQSRIMYDVAGVKAGSVAGIKVLEKAAQGLWVALAGPKAKIIPVGKLCSALADIEGKANKIMVEDLKQGKKEIPPEEWNMQMDEEPTINQMAEVIKEKGQQTLDQVFEIVKGNEHVKKAGEKSQELKTQAWDLINKGKAAYESKQAQDLINKGKDAVGALRK